jgi:hypothetical protein
MGEGTSDHRSDSLGSQEHALLVGKGRASTPVSLTWTLSDQRFVRFKCGIAMLLKSLEPGNHDLQYQQFETIRKLRAGYSNMYMASCESVSSL